MFSDRTQSTISRHNAVIRRKYSPESSSGADVGRETYIQSEDDAHALQTAVDHDRAHSYGSVLSELVTLDTLTVPQRRRTSLPIDDDNVFPTKTFDELEQRLADCVSEVKATSDNTHCAGPKTKPVPATKPARTITGDVLKGGKVVTAKSETKRPSIATKPRLSAPAAFNSIPQETGSRTKPGSAVSTDDVPASSDGAMTSRSSPTNLEIDSCQTNSFDDEWDVNYFSDEKESGEDDIDDRSSNNSIYENVQVKDPTLILVDGIESQLTTKTANENISKSQKVIEEFCQTEKAYVSRLGLIGEDFYKALVLTNQSDPIVNESGMQTIFGNIQTLHQFHDKFLLPELQQCSVEGQQKRCIGEVMKRNAPFLKMYVIYVQNFNNAFDLIEKLKTQSTKFAKFIDNFQKLPVCGKLTIQNHMLEPVQRIPRYELLLKDYINHLPDDSPDRPDATEALKLVSETGIRCNEIMKDLENSLKLFDIIRSISGFENLVKPGCSLIKQGKVVTVRKRTKESHEMHMLLFSDTLLLCRSTAVSLKAQYRLKTLMDILGMKILDGDEHQMIRVHAKQKFVHLRFSSVEEREEWQAALSSIISEYERSTATRSQHHSGGVFETVVCGDCGSRKMALSFCGMAEKKICNNCYTIITARRRLATNEPSNFNSNRPLVKQLIDVTPVIDGFLLSSRDRITWQKRQFAFYQPSVLGSFGCNLQTPESAIFLSEYHMKLVPETNSPSNSVAPVDCSAEFGSKYTFLLTQGKTAIHFRARDHQDLVRWITRLQPPVSVTGETSYR